VFDFEPRTNAGGYFSGRFTVYVTAKWRAMYGGDKTHFSCNSSQIKVTVTGPAAQLRDTQLRSARIHRDLRLAR
jgi:hypothetical protein